MTMKSILPWIINPAATRKVVATPNLKTTMAEFIMRPLVISVRTVVVSVSSMVEISSKPPTNAELRGTGCAIYSGAIKTTNKSSTDFV